MDAPIARRLGLTEAEAATRLATLGPNRLPQAPPTRLTRLLWKQLLQPLTAVLVVAVLLTSVILRELAESIAILAIVALDVIIGATQEDSANKAMAALADLAAPTATVRRDGILRTVAADVIVVGDVIELTAGDRVPADAEIADAQQLQIDEAILTGESLPVDKSADVAPDPTGSPSERRGEVFAGTHVVRGRAVAVVTTTGAATAMGEIAVGLEDRGGQTPLARDLRAAALWIGVLAGVVGSALAVVAFRRAGGGSDALADAALAGVALAVAAVPEGLAAVVTVALALGARDMARQSAIVRRLEAIEALGAANVLCTDKTGTLTTGELALVGTEVVPGVEDAFWAVAARCNDAEGDVGDPVDVVLLAIANRSDATAERPARLAEQPFDATLRLQAVVHPGPVLSVKGAPETVLERCRQGPEVDVLHAAADRWTAQGLRVLALADGTTDRLDASDLRPLGIAAFGDPLRPTAAEAVAGCRRAGVRVVLVTGDNRGTAEAIARATGIDTTHVTTGAELAELPAAARSDALAAADVIARVEPAVKVDLIEALEARVESWP